MKRIKLMFIVSLACLSIAFSQNLQEGQKRWSANNKLSINDFKIKKGDNSSVIYSQFIITHQVGGFDFFKRNFNQKIENIFLGNASWIDTTNVTNIKKQIDFQQMQFDLSEVYTRKFRKQLLQNKRKIAKGFDIVREISNNMTAQFSERRLALIDDTKSGTDEQKLIEWKEKIITELKELDDFRYENTKKIKLPR